MYLYECILTWLGCPLTWFLINYYISLIYHCLLGGSFLTTYYLHDNGQVKQGKRNNDDQVNQWKMQWWGWIVEWCLCTYIAQPIRLWIIYIVPINLLPSSNYAHLVYVYTIMIDGISWMMLYKYYWLAMSLSWTNWMKTTQEAIATTKNW
jgi:hypothetical protein